MYLHYQSASTTPTHHGLIIQAVIFIRSSRMQEEVGADFPNAMVLSERPPSCLLQALQSISQSAVHVRWKSDLVRERADNIIPLLFRLLSDHSCLVEDLLKRQIGSILQSYPALHNRVSSGLILLNQCEESPTARKPFRLDTFIELQCSSVFYFDYIMSICDISAADGPWTGNIQS